MENLLKILSLLEHLAYAIALATFAGLTESLGITQDKGMFLAVLGLAAARWQHTLGKK